MEILTKEEVFINKVHLFKQIEKGKIVLHPTDTIYGFGCNAKDDDAVKKIREIKNDFQRPFSILAPSMQWIKENCIITKKDEEWLKKLPGPYTLILKLKNENAVSRYVNNSLGTIGVRIPMHWIADFIKEFGLPFVSTAATLNENQLLQHPKEASDKCMISVHYAFDDGYLRGTPSTIVNLLENEPKLIKR
ncbi:MAG: L-threonylcarbamoyladenylate synthase [Candidatus Woesearchaeota archaeon]|nr:L-threonylcarbamoyladenylate synthase [Candidatus Woesearchaeota archaeon]